MFNINILSVVMVVKNILLNNILLKYVINNIMSWHLF